MKPLIKVLIPAFNEEDSIAKVIKENVDLEVVGKNFSLVFADVFGTQLHLSALDVVSILNEGRVKH